MTNLPESSRWRASALLLLPALLLIGCDGMDLNGLGSPTGGQPDTAVDGAGDGKPWTILLHTHANPSTHREEAELFKQRISERVGWDGVYAVHREGSSQLFWGRYASVEDASENLARAKEYVTPAGVPVFRQAMVVPVPGKDRPASGTNALALQNARGTYSVLVGVFYDVPKADYVGRRSFAEQYARELRNEGFEVYYFHGPIRSGVTVGSFPSEAVSFTRDASTGAMIPNYSDAIQKVLDHPRFEYLAVNGWAERWKVRNPQTGKVESIPQRPYAVKIPQKESPNSGALRR